MRGTIARMPKIERDHFCQATRLIHAGNMLGAEFLFIEHAASHQLNAATRRQPARFPGLANRWEYRRLSTRSHPRQAYPPDGSSVLRAVGNKLSIR